MAYPNYFPSVYSSFGQPQPQYQMQPQSQNNGGFISIRGGIAAANAYPVANGQSVWLMDADSPTFYIKSVDMSGMPLPLRIFDFAERNVQNMQNVTQHPEPNATQNVQNNTSQQESVNFKDFVTRKEFEEVIARLTSQPKKNPNNQQKEGTKNG